MHGRGALSQVWFLLVVECLRLPNVSCDRCNQHPKVWVPMKNPKDLAMEGFSVMYIYIKKIITYTKLKDGEWPPVCRNTDWENKHHVWYLNITVTYSTLLRDAEYGEHNIHIDVLMIGQDLGDRRYKCYCSTADGRVLIFPCIRTLQLLVFLLEIMKWSTWKGLKHLRWDLTGSHYKKPSQI